MHRCRLLSMVSPRVHIYLCTGDIGHMFLSVSICIGCGALCMLCNPVAWNALCTLLCTFSHFTVVHLFCVQLCVFLFTVCLYAFVFACDFVCACVCRLLTCLCVCMCTCVCEYNHEKSRVLVYNNCIKHHAYTLQHYFKQGCTNYNHSKLE